MTSSPSVLDGPIAYRLSKRLFALRVGLTVASASILSPLVAKAVTYYWDTDGTTPGFGAANGTWGTDPFWSTDILGASGSANSAITTADDVNFGTAALGLAAGVINGPATAQGFLNMTFGSASGPVTLSGGTLNLAATSTINVNNSSDTINSTLQGTGNLTKTGTGTLNLTGTNNYTGVTTFSAGIVNVATLSDYGVASAIGARTAAQEGASNVGLRFLGGTLQYTGSTPQNTNRQVRIGVAGGTIDASGSDPSATLSFTFSGTNTDLFDTGGTRTLTLAGTNTGNNTFAINLINQGASATSLTKTGTGTWILSGAGHNYTGTTTVRQGTLNLSGNRTASGGSITVGDTAGLNATLNITNGNWSTGGTFAVANQANTSVVNHSAGSLTFSGGTQLIVGNNGAGSAGTYNLSGGTLTGAANAVRGVILGVNNSTTGTFNLSGTGNLAMGTSALQVGRSDSGATNSTGIFNQTGGTAAIGTLTIGGSAGTLNAGTSGTLNLTGGTFSAATFSTLAAADNGSATITIGGTAQVTLPAFPTVRGVGATANITFDGGTLSPAAASSAYMSGLTNAFITGNGAKFNVAGGADITISQALKNAAAQTGSLTKLGSGALTLTGANTYSGATSINAGSLNFAGSSSIGSISLSDNTTLGLKVANIGSSVVTTANSPVTFGSAGSTNLSLDFSNLTNPTVPVANLGSGLLTLNGTVNLTLANTAGLTSTPNNTTLALMSYGSQGGGGAFNLLTTSVGHTSFALNDTAAALYLSISANPVTWTGLASNQWNDDVLGGSKNWVLPNSSPTDYINGDVVMFTNTASNFAVDLSENVAPTTVTFTNTTNAYTISSGGGFGITAGSVAVNGTGSVTLASGNSYSGGTTLNSGTLVLNNAAAIGTGTLTINGGTLDTTNATVISANNNQNWNGDFTVAGSTNLDLGAGAVTLGGAGSIRTVTVNSGTFSVGELRATTHGLDKEGSGTLVVGSVGNDVTGSVIAGPLNVGGGTVQINRTGTVAATSGDFTVGGLTGTSTSTMTNGAATERWVFVNTSGTFNFPGTLADGGVSPLGFNKQGAGTQILSGTNTYTGQTTFGGGIVNVASLSDYGVPSAIGARSAAQEGSQNIGLRFTGGTLQYTGSTPQSTNRQVRVGIAGATIDASGSNPNATVSFTYSGTNADLFDTPGTRTLTLTGTNTGDNLFAIGLQDQGASATSLTKNGTGKWILTSTNHTYTGPTTIDAGTLIVNGSLSGSPVTVNTGTLGGSGTITSVINIGNGSGTADATLAPGTGIGTLTSQGAVNLFSDSAFTLEIHSGDLTNDLLATTGTVSLSSAKLNVSDLGTSSLQSGEVFTFISASGGLLGEFTGLPDGALLSVGSSTYQIDYDATSASLVAVPEPGSFGLVVASSTGLLGLRRFRRRG